MTSGCPPRRRCNALLLLLPTKHRLIQAATGSVLDAGAGRCVFDGGLLDYMERLADYAGRVMAGQLIFYNFPQNKDFDDDVRKFLDHFEKVKSE